MKLQELRYSCFNKTLLPDPVLAWITRENLWNLWVPKEFGGRESDFYEGLLKLKQLACIDGSLGWTVTLCSGANYFIGNLHPETAQRFFNSGKTVIMGGSGGAFGTAEYRSDKILLNGKWRYATGAPYLSHYTLTAALMENGKPLLNLSGKPKLQSFILPKEKVKRINDWDMMGLQATATCSFKVENIAVNPKNAFRYDRFYLPYPIFRIPFEVFSDLTLWANYLGMAEHYREEAEKHLKPLAVDKLSGLLEEGNEKLELYSLHVHKKIQNSEKITSEYKGQIHSELSTLLSRINSSIIEIHPKLGMKAARNQEKTNKIFKDYFTATQHHNFVKR